MDREKREKMLQDQKINKLREKNRQSLERERQWKMKIEKLKSQKETEKEQLKSALNQKFNQSISILNQKHRDKINELRQEKLREHQKSKRHQKELDKLKLEQRQRQ